MDKYLETGPALKVVEEMATVLFDHVITRDHRGYPAACTCGTPPANGDAFLHLAQALASSPDVVRAFKECPVTDTTVHQAFAVADRLAPLPESREAATTLAWTRHYAALALAAHAAFRDATRKLQPTVGPGSRPDLGYLIEMAVTATAAAVALTPTTEHVGELLWCLTPEAGSLNGEYLDWLTEALDGLGINPAEIYPDFNAADFESAVVGQTEEPIGG